MGWGGRRWAGARGKAEARTVYVRTRKVDSDARRRRKVYSAARRRRRARQERGWGRESGHNFGDI